MTTSRIGGSLGVGAALQRHCWGGSFVELALPLDRRHVNAPFRAPASRGSGVSGPGPRLPSRFDPEVSYEIERLAVRGWPAEEVEEVEGWLLRRTVGVERRRSNSLLPPQEPGRAARTVELALATTEELGFDPVVQVSPAEVHRRLDDDLEARGFERSGPTLVLAGPLRPAPSGPSVTVEVGPLTAEWLDAWAVTGGGAGVEESGDRVLSQLGERARFATVFDPASGAPTGTGIGVAEAGWLGLFSLTVVRGTRRQGVGSAIVDALQSWGAARGARSVYLQVEADNVAALAFYARRDFSVAHSYHYRSA
jgi:GNAT superfamily N-acetyltransferase